MDTKWKNITKNILICISVFIIGIFLACVNSFANKTIFSEALRGANYTQSTAFTERIYTDLRDLISYEDNITSTDSDDYHFSSTSSYGYLYACLPYSDDDSIISDYNSSDYSIKYDLKNLAQTISWDTSLLYSKDYSSINNLQSTIESCLLNDHPYTYAVSPRSFLANGETLNSDYFSLDYIYDEYSDLNSLAIVSYPDSKITSYSSSWNLTCIFVQTTSILSILSVLYLIAILFVIKPSDKCEYKYRDILLIIALFSYPLIHILINYLSEYFISSTHYCDTLQITSSQLISAILIICVISCIYRILYTCSLSIKAHTMYQTSAMHIIADWGCTHNISIIKGIKFVFKSMRTFIQMVCRTVKSCIIRICHLFVNINYYPKGIKHAQKLLFRFSTIILTLVSISLGIFLYETITIYNTIPTGYGIYTVSRWVKKDYIGFATFVADPYNLAIVFAIYLAVYLVIFIVNQYFGNKLITSSRLLEDQIERIYEGEYKIDPSLGQNSPFQKDIFMLANIGSGLEKTLDEKIKSERMKVELVTNVSHDLKTPLTSIISYIDLLDRRDDLSDEARDYVRIIAKKSDRLKHIVYDVFELAKTTSGEIVVNKELLNLNKLLIQTTTDLNDNITKAGMILKLQTNIDDIYIYSDGHRIYRVLQNLIDNALKYSLQGTRIYVQEKPDKDKVSVIIKNTANYEMNFTEEEVTERFFRGDKSRNSEGNGLGLSIAKGFTIACGGEFDIKIDGDQFNVILTFPVTKDSPDSTGNE